MNLEKQAELALELKRAKTAESQWYNLRPILGHANWAIFYLLLGGREVGKSYSVTNFFVDQYRNKGIPFTITKIIKNIQYRDLTTLTFSPIGLQIQINGTAKKSRFITSGY